MISEVTYQAIGNYGFIEKDVTIASRFLTSWRDK